jgi:hypothetical protein
MYQIIQNFRDGKDIFGNANSTAAKRIKTFNDGVRGLCNARNLNPSINEVLKRGRASVRDPRVLGRIVSRLVTVGLIASIVGQGTTFASALDNMATSGNYAKVIANLEAGNLVAADKAMFGDGRLLQEPSVANDLFKGLGDNNAARAGWLAFMQALEKAWDSAIENSKKPNASTTDMFNLVRQGGN